MKKTRTKPTVGQILYARRIRDRHHRGNEELIPVEVISVGRKYFKAVPPDSKDYPHLAIEYHIEDWTEHQAYSPDWQLYASQQERQDEVDHESLSQCMRAIFGGYGTPNVSLATLRRCHELITQDQKLRGFDQ